MKRLLVAILLLVCLLSVSFGFVLWKRYSFSGLNGTADTTVILPGDLLINSDDFLIRLKGDTIAEGNAKLQATLYVKPRGSSWLTFPFATKLRPVDSWVLDTLANHNGVLKLAILLADSAKIKVAGDSSGQAVKNCTLEVRVKQ